MWTNWSFQTIQLSSFYQRSKNVKPDWCSSQVSHVIVHMLEHIWRNGMLLYHFCSITHKHAYFWMHRNTCMTFHIYQHVQNSITHNVYSTVSHNTMHSTWLFLFSVINIRYNFIPPTLIHYSIRHPKTNTTVQTGAGTFYFTCLN